MPKQALLQAIEGLNEQECERLAEAIASMEAEPIAGGDTTVRTLIGRLSAKFRDGKSESPSARDEQVAQMIIAAFNAMPFARHLGLELTEITSRRALGKIHLKPELESIDRTLHGGVLLCLCDHVGGVSALAHMLIGPRQWGFEDIRGLVTLEQNMSFIRLARIGDTLHATGRVVHAGRKILVTQQVIKDQNGKEVARGRQSLFLSLHRSKAEAPNVEP